MTQPRGTRRGTRTRRRRYTLLDHLMLAGIIGGGGYLALHHLAHVPGLTSAVFASIGYGFALGSVVPVPRYRSPIVWRRGR